MEPASSSKQSQINNSFFFAPAAPEEIILIIRNLKSKKAIREQDIDTNFLKYSNQIISPFICDLYNSCIEQGKFPNALKIAEMRTKRQTTDQYHYCQNLVKYWKN